LNNGSLAMADDAAKVRRMADPRVAIITRTQNRPITLNRALEGILRQTFTDWELVLVSDAGNLAAIREVVARHGEALGDRLRLIHRERSEGMQAASNHGIAESRSRYIAIHDDDDSWHPDFLARTVAYLDAAAPHQRGVVVGAELVYERFKNDRFIEIRRRRMSVPAESLVPSALRRYNRFPPIAFLYERAAGEMLGQYRTDLPVLGDWDFNLRFAERFGIGIIDEPLAYWHHRPKSWALPGLYANSSYLLHLGDQMRLQREWGQIPDLWRYLMLWRY
jgi:glycosyltransferase involved in cell wall biosynthesis